MKAWLRIFSTGHTDPDTGLPAITASQSSAIVSILSAGTFFGSLGVGHPVPLGFPVQIDLLQQLGSSSW